MKSLKTTRIRTILAVLVTTVLVISVTGTALASHPEASLPGSNFEIDDNANLKLDDPSPSVDWGSLAHPDGPELRATDKPTGQNDDSYQGGVKEDTACPGETTGSIPNNKSDLLTFHVYTEPGNNSNPAGYMNLAWSRVSDPSGTTLMDFEFNQSSTNCAGGPNRIRTTGDLLIEYAIDQGGARANISGRFWNGSAWGPSQSLSTGTACGGGPCAVGTINSTAIPVSPTDESDGLGAKSARTFGEAQIDLRLIFQSGKCTTFGSAMLKSRSSDSFTSQLKDFIRPIGINLTNCGTVTIIKHTEPAGVNQNFGFTSTLAGSQISCSLDATPASFTLNDADMDTETCTNVPIGSYTVTEGADPSGFVFGSLTCQTTGTGSGSQDGSNQKKANITIAAGEDTVTCTYVNNQQLGAIKVSKISGKTGYSLVGAKFSVTGPNNFSTTLTTGSDGTACVDSLVFGSYTVTETVAPTGFIIDDSSGHSVTVDNNAKCSDDPYNGEALTFTDTPTADIQVNFRDGGSGETSATITCDDSTGTANTTPATGWDTSKTVTGVAAPTTITCVIEIDP
jgi:hypothetical protein